jgi:hypothetical protein
VGGVIGPAAVPLRARRRSHEHEAEQNRCAGDLHDGDDLSHGMPRIRQRLAQPRDVHLQRLGGLRRGTLPPELIDQPVGAERLIGVNEEQGQQRSLVASAKRERAALVEGLEWAKDAEIHFQRGARAVTQPTPAPPGSPPRCRRVVAALWPLRRRAAAAPPHDRSRCCPHRTSRAAAEAATRRQEAVMGKALASQYPAVVLRSHYTAVRALLAVAMDAVAPVGRG